MTTFSQVPTILSVYIFTNPKSCLYVLRQITLHYTTQPTFPLLRVDMDPIQPNPNKQSLSGFKLILACAHFA